MRQDDLIEYLSSKKSYIKARELALFLGVSTRQIRNIISKINEKEIIIESSNAGYKIIKNNYKSDTISDPRNRKKQIINKLLLNEEGINIYDLADILYSSESTILKDIIDIRKELAKFNLQVLQKNNFLYIKGNENNKRKYIRNLISNQSFNLMYLNEDYISNKTNISLSKLRKTINDLLIESKISSNDFCINNIALHLLIIIDRLIKGFCLEDELNNFDFKYDDDLTKNVTIKIIKTIEKQYEVNFGSQEALNLYFLVKNNINQTLLDNYDNLNMHNISNYIDEYYIKITREILRELEQHYLLEPFKDNFIIKLTLHIQNLYFRYGNRYNIENPLMDLIKKDYPLIYDMAVYIAQKLKQKDGLIISEDEIAFISYHLGSYFECNSFEKSIKLNCIFVYASYYDYYKITLDRLIKKFNNYINIIQITSISQFNTDAIFENENIDLYIFTNMIKNLPNSNKIVQISPFLYSEDLAKLENIIEEKRNKKILYELEDYIFTFFNETLYNRLDEKLTKDLFLDKMCNYLEANNYVKNTYYSDILSREKLSPTVYNNIAVPHTMTTKSTLETFISFTILDNPIEWDTNKFVNIVVMIGINENSKKLFSYFFDRIIKMLNNPINVKRITETNTYEEICNVIKSFYE